MQIKSISLSDIKPYDKNAKKHTPEQIEHIVNSIKKFGMNDPIGIWGNENIIVEGHGRYLALKKMGISDVDCIRLDHLTDEERRAYALTHNQTTFETSFDLELLNIELNSILNINMSDFGFDDFAEQDYGTDFTLPDNDKPSFTDMTFTLANEQAECIKKAMAAVKKDIYETFGNQNSNGNALYEVVRQWVELKKSN